MSYFVSDPMVFLIGREYQIVFNTTEPGFGWAMVNGVRYTDSVAGLMRSDRSVHKVHVPADELDRAGCYTVVFQQMLDRLPYYAVRGESEEKTYAFHAPKCENGFSLYQIADTHCAVDVPAEAAKYHGDSLDFLVFNGDINESSDTYENFLTAFRLSEKVTHGERAIIYARGNHDTRGHHAPELLNYISTDGERTYYTFRTGALWGLVLDYGEDKPDASEEYGGVIDFDRFRQEETAWLRDLVRRGSEEYDAEGVKWRIVICHVPFNEDMGKSGAKFGIANETYDEWVRLVNEMGVDIMLCGHMHRAYFDLPGDERDFRGQNFPVAVGSIPVRADKDGHPVYTGMAVDVDEKTIRASIVTSDFEVKDTLTVEVGRRGRA